MRVEILAKDQVIGVAELVNLDPPMGGAFGRFDPSEAYDQDLHANLIEGEYQGDRGRDFTVRSAHMGQIECHGVSIHDISKTLAEYEATVFEIPYPQYELYFGQMQQFKMYWGK